MSVSLHPSRHELDLHCNELEKKIGEQNHKKNDRLKQMLPLESIINRINGEFKSIIFWIGAIFTVFIVPIVYAIIKACAERMMSRINAQIKDIDANVHRLVAELRQIKPALAPARRGVHFGAARQRVFEKKEAPVQVGQADSVEFRPQGKR